MPEIGVYVVFLISKSGRHETPGDTWYLYPECSRSMVITAIPAVADHDGAPQIAGINGAIQGS